MNIPGPTPAQRARFAATLDALLPPGRPIIVGVSGGPDSLALLLLLAATRHGETIAATVDHRLREESKREAMEVGALCRRIGIHHRILPVKVPDDPEGPQASAREARYEALAWYCRHKGAAALATAHHVDDQAETVLMRLARGAGVAGLAGVRDRRPLDDQGDVALIRPLLGWSRSELAAIVSAARIEAADDPSNRDERYDRTRARALMTQGHFEPARLAAVARHMADADEALDWTAQALLADRFAPAGDGATLDPSGLPRELVRRMTIAALARLDGATPRGDELARLLDRLESGHVSTLGSMQVTPGSPWRLARVPPHRAT